MELAPLYKRHYYYIKNCALVVNFNAFIYVKNITAHSTYCDTTSDGRRSDNTLK